MIPRRRFLGGAAAGAGTVALPLSLTSPAAALTTAISTAGTASRAPADAEPDRPRAWSRSYDDQLTGRAVTPWVAGSAVFAVVGSAVDGSATAEEEQFLQAYARNDGSATYRLPLPPKGAWGQDDSATFVHDAGELRAYALDDGALRWQTAVDYRPSEFVGGAGARVIGVERVVGGRGTLVCHAAETGEEQWRTTLDSAMFSRPLLTADAVFLAYAGGAAERLDATTGERRWRTGTSRRSVSALPTLVSHDGLLYHWQQGATRVFDADSGGLVRTLTLDAPPVFDEQRAYHLRDGALVARPHAADGDDRTLWTYDPATTITAVSEADDDRIAVAGSDRTVTLLEAATGKPLWTLGSPEQAEGPVLAVGNGVVVVSWDGRVLEAYPTGAG